MFLSNPGKCKGSGDCVDACPTKSIKFMELEETMADLPFLPDSSKTKPCLFVKPSKRAKEVMAND